MPALFRNIALAETADAESLDELLAAGLQRYIVRRLGPCAVQVDHERLAEIRRLFQRLGQTPRIVHE